MKTFPDSSITKNLFLLAFITLTIFFLTQGTLEAQAQKIPTHNTSLNCIDATDTLIAGRVTACITTDSLILKIHYFLGSPVYCYPSNGTLDLGGSTQIISSLTLEDGSKIVNGAFDLDDLTTPNTSTESCSAQESFLIEDYLYYNVKYVHNTFDLKGSILLLPSLNFSTGSRIINGTLIIDSSAINKPCIDQTLQFSNF